MANEKTKYTLDQTIRYWEDEVIHIVHKLQHEKCNVIDYIRMVNRLSYAAKRLEILQFAAIKRTKPKTA